MKRYSSAPCLADLDADTKRIKAIDPRSEPNAREYLQLALARVLELQREIKDGTYVSRRAGLEERTSDLEDSSSDEELTKEVLRKVFEDLPGTPSSASAIIDKAGRPRNPELNVVRSKRIQLLGYDTCRRTAVEFMKSAARDTRAPPTNGNPHHPHHSHHSGFRVGTYSRNEPRVAHRRTGLLLRDPCRREAAGSYDSEIRERMLRSLDLHLAARQRDYTAKLMRTGLHF